MKAAVNIARVAVGVLFIVSGLVKANDPLGLSYKMQEFFEVWTTDLAASPFFLKNALLQLITFSNAHALALSIGMIALEIMAGAALLVGWQKRLVVPLLLALIVFFTFLTGYAYASGKFKNCGCFGDCLPISPLTSFLKDLLLLGLILFLFFTRKYIKPVSARRVQGTTLALFILLSFGLQWYVLRYLPLADCLPYKKGASIAAGMKPPPNAVPDSFAISFVYARDGKTFDFSPQNLPADLSTYKFVERKDKLVRKGNAEPAIKGFALSGVTDVDSTNIVLAQPKAVLYFYETKGFVPKSVQQNLSAVYAAASAKQIPVYVATTALASLRNGFEYNGFNTGAMAGLQLFKIDFTAFRTAARTNPCIYLLQNGTIKDKQSRHRSETILKELAATP